MSDIKKILIVDDHPIFRKGLIAILEQARDVEIFAEAGSSEEALTIIQHSVPDIIILDINLPGLDGIEFSRLIKQVYKNIIVILLTMHKDEEIFNRTFEYGVDAYVLKENASDELLKAIESTRNMNYYLSPSMSEFILNRKMRHNQLIDEKPGLNCLTDKEHEILKLISLNKSTKEIASDLFVSYKTIENHRSSICKKLNISGNNALLRFIIENKEKI